MDIERLVREEFTRGLQEGERGRSSLQTAWNFQCEPFSGEEPLREVFVGREEAVVRLARALGRSVMGVREIIACIGPRGSGISATLRVVHEALQESGKVVGAFETAQALLECHEREEDDGETSLETYFEIFLEEADFRNVRYVVIDEADRVAEYIPDYARRIKEAAGVFKEQPAIVLGLHLSGWLSLPASFREQIAEQIWLGPMDVEEIVELLKRRISWAKSGEGLDPFDDQTLLQLAEASQGLPGLAIKLSRLILHECLSRGLDQIRPALVDEIARAYGFDVIERLAEWGLSEDETRTTIVENLVRRPFGVTSSGLADITSMGRTTVNYHLAFLEEMGVLVKQRKGRKVLYALAEVAGIGLEILVFRRITQGMGLWH
jgi:DNA-binding transcriptional ArsR family regulator